MSHSVQLICKLRAHVCRVDLHEQMSSNVEQLARAVYFWRALLFFLAYNGSPTLPRAVDILSFVRSKLMSGSDASGDLFFAMLNWMGECAAARAPAP